MVTDSLCPGQAAYIKAVFPVLSCKSTFAPALKVDLKSLYSRF